MSELDDLFDRLDALDRGSGPWVNIAEVIIQRVRTMGPDQRDALSDENSVIVTGLSSASRDAFEYAQEQMEAFGMEILAPIVGYEDEREDVVSVAVEAITKYREARDGEGALPGLEVVEDEEEAPVEAEAVVE